MIVTTFTCDRCGHSQTKSEDMWVIYIRCNSANLGSYKSDVEGLKALWCRACCIKMGILSTPRSEEKQIVPNPLPSLEDVIREIIKEEILSAKEA